MSEENSKDCCILVGLYPPEVLTFRVDSRIVGSLRTPTFMANLLFMANHPILWWVLHYPARVRQLAMAILHNSNFLRILVLLINKRTCEPDASLFDFYFLFLLGKLRFSEPPSSGFKIENVQRDKLCK